MLDKTMKALVLEKTMPVEKAPLKLTRLAVPKPKSNEVLVRVHACAVCRTDLHIVEGELPVHKKNIVPGHQVVGEVVALGERVKNHKIGEIVGITWINSACGKCEFCRRGMENLCENMKFTGYDENGGYAEYIAVAEDYAFSIPKGFDEAHAAPLFCAGIIGYRAFKLSGVKRGGKLAMFGFGGSAHIIIQVARHLGIETFVFTRDEKHQEEAKSLGAAWVGKPDSKPPCMFDSAIIFAPDGKLVLYALENLKRGGNVTIADIYMSKIPELDYGLLYEERSIKSVANYTRDDAREFLDLAAKIPIKTQIQEFALEDTNKAMLLLKQSKIDGSAVIMVGR
ncbi:MAG: zinc-dependent alcohol dehydrogenase family protein [Candidatus Micrarchaeia archaeon]